MEEKRAEVEHSDSEDSSDYSDDSVGEVDESVAEDMLNLEDTFKGISQRFRLINRIGEGATSLINASIRSAGRIPLTGNTWFQEPSLPCTRPKIYFTSTTITIGTLKQKMKGSGCHHHSRRGEQTTFSPHQQVTSENGGKEQDHNSSPSRRST